MFQEVRVGGDLKPLGVMPEGRPLLFEYLDILDLPVLPKRFTGIARTTRDWWRRRYPPTSRSNWRQASRADLDRLMPEMADDAPRRNSPVRTNGERSKDRSYTVPTTRTPSWLGVIPLTTPDLSEDTVEVRRGLVYQTGPNTQFHECNDSWNYPIESVYPFCGLVRSSDHVEWVGYTPETHPEDIRYSRGHFDSFETTLGTPLLVPTRNYPTTPISPTQSEVNTARYNALLNMYAGTPPTVPNVVRALLELKDTKQTIRGLIHFYKWCRTASSGLGFWRKTLNGWQRLSGRQVARLSTSEMAGAYLNAVFGILPTLDDIRTFMGRLFNGLAIWSIPQGMHAQPGYVITSRYHVKPRFDVATKLLSVEQKVRLNTRIIDRKVMTCVADLSARTPPSNLLRDAPDVLVTTVDGCVFARLKTDLSQYFLENFGRVGMTWSYPPILTAWELTPWSWLIDWFAKTRQSIRLAERAARSWWMRVGFEEPWLAERSVTTRYCHRLLENRAISSDNRVFWPSYNQRVLDCTVSSLYAIMPASHYVVSGSFWRGRYESAPVVGSEATRVTVRLFQISIGMALVLNTK